VIAESCDDFIAQENDDLMQEVEKLKKEVAKLKGKEKVQPSQAHGEEA
jgi:cell division protein FtsB